MCIVVDANAAHHLSGADASGKPVLNWLLRGKGKLVVSKALLKELLKANFGSVVVQLDRAGKVIRVDESACENARKAIANSGSAKSNDAHVLAILQITKCDTLFTHDQPLHKDVKNKGIIGHSCSIYQDQTHTALLGDCQC